MPYPSANTLYEIADDIGEPARSIVRAAADELVERRRAMLLHDDEIGKMRQALRVNIIRLAPQTTHDEIDALISSL